MGWVGSGLYQTRNPARLPKSQAYHVQSMSSGLKFKIRFVRVIFCLGLV